MKLEVTAKKDGFRRAGRAWSATPTIIDTSDKEWTKAKIQQLQDEPMLTVVELSAAQVKKLEAETKKEAE